MTKKGGASDKSSSAKKASSTASSLEWKDLIIAALSLSLAIAVGHILTHENTAASKGLKSTSTSIMDDFGYTYGSDGVEIRTDLPQGSYGGIYNEDFLKIVKPLYDSHMGTENMAPLLYSLVRFVKPRHILEIGAGYTSIFLLQALKDNMLEMKKFKKLSDVGKCTIPLNSTVEIDQCVEDEVEKRSEAGILHTVDDLSHPGETASKVQAAAKKLGSRQHLQLHIKDAWGFSQEMDSDVMLDMIWLDFGAGSRLEEFFDKWWPRLNPNGGLLMVHSSLTNAATRQFLVNYQASDDSESKDRLGEFDLWGLLEPHKKYQNSFSVFQKRNNAYMEPIYSLGP